MLSSNEREQLKLLQRLYDLVGRMTSDDVDWLLKPFTDYSVDDRGKAKIEAWVRNPDHVTSIIRIAEEHLNDQERIH
jgi:hypothetical protein